MANDGPLSIATIRRDHREGEPILPGAGTVCMGCGQNWPCDAIRAADVIDALMAALTYLADQDHWSEHESDFGTWWEFDGGPLPDIQEGWELAQAALAAAAALWQGRHE